MSAFSDHQVRAATGSFGSRAVDPPHEPDAAKPSSTLLMPVSSCTPTGGLGHQESVMTASFHAAQSGDLKPSGRIWTLSRVERSRLTAAGWGAAGHTRWRPRFGQWVQEAVCLFPSHLRHPIIGDVKVCHLGLTRYLPVTHSV